MNSNGLNHFFRIVWNASKEAWFVLRRAAAPFGLGRHPLVIDGPSIDKL
jgi:hypothetical protein